MCIKKQKIYLTTVTRTVQFLAIVFMPIGFSDLGATNQYSSSGSDDVVRSLDSHVLGDDVAEKKTGDTPSPSRIPTVVELGEKNEKTSDSQILQLVQQMGTLTGQMAAVMRANKREQAAAEVLAAGRNVVQIVVQNQPKQATE